MTDRAKAMTLIAAVALLLAGGACSDAPRAGAAEKADEHAEGEKGEHADEHGDEHAEGEGTEGRVTLSEAAFTAAGIQTEVVRSEDSGAAGAGALQVPGQVDFDPARVAVVSPRTSGRIERLAAAPGDRVRVGQTVALISSPAFLTAQSDLVQAVRRAQLLAGTGDEPGARALVAAARRRLQLLGAGSATIARLEQGGEPGALLGVGAPFAGSIMEILAPAGSAVEAGTPIFRIADLSTVLVGADVPERATTSLRPGQGATVRLNAMPEESFAGRVERLGDVVDPATRTVKAYIRVPNGARALRPGMFATVTLDAPAAAGAATPVAVLTVSEATVVTDGDTRYVFVEVAPRTYERRAVEVAPGGASGRVVVTSGLAAGEPVVVRGAFTLKSELGKAGFGGHDH